MTGFFPQPKPASRLQIAKVEKKLTMITEKDFKHDVWERDKRMCRKCGRKVLKTVSRVPERGEVHHIAGRTGDLRFESRAALLLCAECHEQVTGRVAEKWLIVAVPGGKVFQPMHDFERIDASGPVGFERIV